MRLALAFLPVFLAGTLVAGAPAPPQLPQKVGKSDLIVVGKVGEVAAATIKAERFKGDEAEMRVAAVAVSEAVLGAKTKTIKVAFVVPTAGRLKTGRIFPALTAGQEGLLYLTKHPTQKGVFVYGGYGDFVVKPMNESFVTELAEAKKLARALTNFKTALASKDADERFSAVSVIVHRYRTPRGGDGATEAVPADESKLILMALAEADWKAAGGPRGFGANPQGLFYRLGVTAADGWKPSGHDLTFADEARKWLAVNAGTFKMKRYKGTALPERDITEPE